jgi:hypothetical protein
VERRTFSKKIFSVLALGGLLLFVGCGKQEQPVGFGNQEKLWNLVSGQQNLEEPTELAYSKGTPALYRDASMGKVDPNFVPRLTGG